MGWLRQNSRTNITETAMSPVVEYAQRLVERTIAEIDRADTKAALLLTGSGVIFGVGTSVFVAEAPQLSHLPLRITIPLLTAVGSAVGALIALGSAAYPRGIGSSSPGMRSVVYFTDVVRAGDVSRLRSAILQSIADHEDVVLKQLIQVSRIVARKYLLIKIAFCFFVVILFASADCAAEALFR